MTPYNKLIGLNVALPLGAVLSQKCECILAGSFEIRCLPQPALNTDVNIRSAKYLIIESKCQCRQCNTLTAVFALAVPPGYESLGDVDHEPGDGPEIWEVPGPAAVLSYVEYLPENIAEKVRTLTPHYRVDFDVESGRRLWLNHCEHCGTQMLEEQLHGESDGPFTSTPSEGLEAIRLHEAPELFAAWVGAETLEMRPLDS